MSVALDTIVLSGAGLASVTDVQIQLSPFLVTRLTGAARRLAVRHAQETGGLYAQVRQ